MGLRVRGNLPGPWGRRRYDRRPILPRGGRSPRPDEAAACPPSIAPVMTSSSATSAGPSWSPSTASSSATRSRRSPPSARFRRAAGRRSCSRASSAARRVGRYSFVGAGPFLRFQASAMRSDRDDRPGLGTAGRRTSGTPRPAARCWKSGSTPYRPPHLRACRVLRRRGRLRRATTPSATSNGCRTRPAGRPRLARPVRSRFTTAWSSSTTSTRPSRSSLMPAVDPPRSRGSYDRGLPARRSTWSSGCNRAVGRLQLTDIAPSARPQLSPVRPTSRQATLRGGRRDAARSTSRPATSSRSSSASGSQTETKARPFDIYRTLRVVNPSPFMFYLQGCGHCSWSAARRRSWCRVEDDR